jgi:hypothetical protein
VLESRGGMEGPALRQAQLTVNPELPHQNFGASTTIH